MTKFGNVKINYYIVVRIYETDHMNKQKREKYFKLLENIEKKETQDQPNSRILLIDGLNTVIRCHCAAPVMSEKGHHVGGVTGYFNSVNYAIRNLKPTRVIHVFDGKGGSQRRRKMFPGYKARRHATKNIINDALYSSVEEETESLARQLKTLANYLSVLPVGILSKDRVEADDVIAYITEYFMQENDDTEIYIMSTDKDYLQLINNRVLVWSPTKKKLYTEEVIQEEFGIPAQNLLYYRAIDGDASDEIPGIKGWGLKTIQTKLPFLTEKSTEIGTDTIFNYISDKLDDAKVYRVLHENREQFELNCRLMQLQHVEISERTKESIRNYVNTPINRLVKHKFIQMLVADGLNTMGGLKSPELWLKENYWKLDVFASLTHNK